MNLKTESINKNFSSFAKLLHWGFVILFLYGLLKQIDSINQLEDDNLLMFEVIFALAFLLLLIIRFVYMKTTQQSSIPDHTPKSQKLAAKIVSLWQVYMPCIDSIFWINNWLVIWVRFKGWFLINLVIGIHEFAVSIILLALLDSILLLQLIIA